MHISCRKGPLGSPKALIELRGMIIAFLAAGPE